LRKQANGAAGAPVPTLVARRAKAGEKARDFPTFQTSASDQADPRLGDVGDRLRLREAFTPSQPIVERTRFAGRRQVLASLIRAIEDQRQHVVIYGERGIGKTSLLHVVAQAAREARYLVVYVSCGATSNFDEFFRAVADGVPLLYHADFGPTSPEGERGGTFADLLSATEVSVRSASQLCAKIAGTRVLVLLDEFDRVEQPEFRRNIAEFIKNLSDQTIRLQLVIAGVARNLTEIIAEIPSVQRNIFALEAPPMSDKEVRELIGRGGDIGRLDYSQGAADLIVESANGLPYLASLLGHHAGLNALDAGRRQVTREDVGGAIATALAGFKARMPRQIQAQLAGFAREAGQAVLAPLAGTAQLGGGELTAEDLVATFPSPDMRANAIRLLDRLRHAGLISVIEEGPSRAAYQFADVSVAPYLWLLAAQAHAETQSAPAAPVKPPQPVSEAPTAPARPR
jgi:hypothetical protein